MGRAPRSACKADADPRRIQVDSPRKCGVQCDVMGPKSRLSVHVDLREIHMFFNAEPVGGSRAETTLVLLNNHASCHSCTEETSTVLFSSGFVSIRQRQMGQYGD